MSKLQRAANISEIVSAASLILAIFLATITLLNDRNTSKKSFTLEYVQPYLVGKVYQDRLVLFNEIDSFRQIIFGQSSTSPTAPQSEVSLYLAKRMRSIQSAGDRELRNAIIGISQFYNSLSSCISANVCDQHVSFALTQEEAPYLLCLLESSFEELENQTANLTLDFGLRDLSNGYICDNALPIRNEGNENL